MAVDRHYRFLLSVRIITRVHQRYSAKEYSVKEYNIDDNFAEAAVLPRRAVNVFLENRGTLRDSTMIRLVYCASLPFIVWAFVLPALFYRWSLKGAALIHSPLIWIAHGATARSLRVHLKDIVFRAYYRVNRLFAVFVLLLLVTKIFIYYIWSDLASSWSSIPGLSRLDAIIRPETFPPWQLASAANALLAWFLYMASDWMLDRLDHRSRVHEKIVEIVLRWLSLLRGTLSVYTIFCCIYLAASLTRRFGLPPMGTGFLPWQ